MDKNGIIDELGDRCWYNPEGQLHRIDGPAMIDDEGREWWYRHGVQHREDGPAFVGIVHKTFYLDGVRYTEVDNWLLALDISDADRVLLKMQWG